MHLFGSRLRHKKTPGRFFFEKRVRAFFNRANAGNQQPRGQVCNNGFRFHVACFRCRVSEPLLPTSKNGHLNTDTFCWKTASRMHWFIFLFFCAKIEA